MDIAPDTLQSVTLYKQVHTLYSVGLPDKKWLISLSKCAL